MAWFGKKKDEGGDKPVRADERYESQGETITLLQDTGDEGESYQMLDVSMGGFAVKGYEGRLKGGQYFEFRFNGNLEGEDAKVDGFANIVRVKDGMLAAKFTPQPRIKTFFRDYFSKK